MNTIEPTTPEEVTTAAVESSDVQSGSDSVAPVKVVGRLGRWQDAPVDAEDDIDIEDMDEEIELPIEEERRIDAAADKIMGTDGEAHGVLAMELKQQLKRQAAAQKARKELLQQIVNQFVSGIESIAEDVDSFTYEEDLSEEEIEAKKEPRQTEYRLTTLFRVKPIQVTEVMSYLAKVKGSFYRKEPVKDAEGNPTEEVKEILDINGGVQELMESGLYREVYSRLYLPVENGKVVKYKKHDPTKHFEAMDELDLGQMIGAAYRFFTQCGLFSARDIAAFFLSRINL